MESFPFLPAAVARWAAEDPESPFLFWRDGWIWRWWSWRQVAALVDDWAAALRSARTPRGERALPPGSRAAFAGDLYPTAIFLDLAAQAAGLTAVPVTLAGRPAPGRPPASDASLAAQRGGDCEAEPSSTARLHADLQALAAPPCDVWLEVFAAALHWWPPAVEPQEEDRLSGESSDPRDFGAGMLVQEAAGWRWVGQPEVRRRAAEIGQALGDTPGGPGARREILVAGWPLACPAARSLLAWATTTGAAVVLEGDAGSRIGTLAWARPTVAHGDAEELAALQRQVEAAAPRRQRHARRSPRTSPKPPFGRLRVVFMSGAPAVAPSHGGQPAVVEISGDPAVAEIPAGSGSGGGVQDGPRGGGDPDFWRRQGVRLVPLPALATSPLQPRRVDPAG